MRFLVPGGAGYIGSHMVNLLQSLNHEVVVLDDFSTGFKWAIKDCEVWDLNLLDKVRLKKYMTNQRFDSVFHFAAKSLVSESVQKPIFYYENNISGTINLINEMILNDIENLVFSSSAAIYGIPEKKIIDEDDKKQPINPYGNSKLIVENILRDICESKKLSVTCFRYFNAAGADESGLIGEAHDPETHLIPNILNSVLENNNFCIYGNDYSTPDGTCIRDFIHVNDLAKAHLLGYEYMQKNKGFFAFNLGNGSGYSVLEVIESCQRVVGEKIYYKIEPRREGDPDILVANAKHAFDTLGWETEYKSLDAIVNSAWKWHNR